MRHVTIALFLSVLLVLAISIVPVVRRARDYVQRVLRERFAVALASTPGSEAGLGNASRRLSGLVAGVSSTAPDPSPGAGGDGGGAGGTSGGGGVAPAASLVGAPFIGSFGDSVAVFARVAIHDAARIAHLSASIDVVVEGGGREVARPAGAQVPSILGWSPVDAPNSVIDGAKLLEPSNGDWLIVAELHDDVVTRFRLTVEPKAGNA